MSTLFEVVKQYRSVYIMTHRSPDADAIASAFGLYTLLLNLGVNPTIIISDENESFKVNVQKLIERYDIPIIFRPLESHIQDEDMLLLVDCQYDAANTARVPARNIGVIDHHFESDSGDYIFKDVQPKVGACCSIIFQYLYDAKAKINQDLATILYFGIYMDTGGFAGRLTNLDLDAKNYLEPLVSTRDFDQLRLSSLNFSDLDILADGLQKTERHGTIVFSNFALCDDNLLGHIADLLTEINDTQIVVIYSEREHGYKLSIRSYHDYITAEDLALLLTRDVGGGGGSRHKAGGFILKKEFGETFIDLSFPLYLKTRAIDFTRTVVLYEAGKDDPTIILGESNFLSYAKREYTLRFFPVNNYFSENVDVKTLEGLAEATPEDIVVIGLKGEIWPVSKEYFSNNYNIVDGYQGECLSDNYLDNYGVTLQSETKAIRVTREESSTFQVCSPKKGKHIRACELNNPTKVRTKWGDFSGKAGDYLIYHSKEDYYICDGEIFHLTYQHYRVP